MKTEDKNIHLITFQEMKMYGMQLFNLKIESDHSNVFEIEETEEQIILKISSVSGSRSMAITKQDFAVFIEQLQFIYPRLLKP